MKTQIMAAFLLAATPTTAPARGFNLFLDEKAGSVTLAVMDAESGLAAVAVGAEDLRLLDPAEARAATEALFGGDCAAPQIEAGVTGKSKIIIHKMGYDEDEQDIRNERQTRIARRDRFQGDGDDQSLTADAPLSNSPAVRHRKIRVTGADAGEARRFIEDAGGLDATEKAAMKQAVGL